MKALLSPIYSSAPSMKVPRHKPLLYYRVREVFDVKMKNILLSSEWLSVCRSFFFLATFDNDLMHKFHLYFFFRPDCNYLTMQQCSVRSRFIRSQVPYIFLTLPIQSSLKNLCQHESAGGKNLLFT